MLRHALLIGCALVASSTIASATCGDKGGPGIRGADGKCQAWESVGRNCGSSPGERGCTVERDIPGAGEALKGGANTDALMRKAHGLPPR
jgi:hypothetical protein